MSFESAKKPMTRTLTSFSPVDDSVLWSGNASSPENVAGAMQAAAEAAERWRSVDLQRRCEIVRRYAEILKDRRSEVESLISREVGKLPWDAATEVNAAVAKAQWSIQAIQQRRSDQQIESDSPATGNPASTDNPAAGKLTSGSMQRTIRYHPLGVCLVLGPFNFPLHLPGGQIIPALLAGNSVVLKPSEQAIAVSHWMLDAWRTAGLPEDVLQLIVGGADVAESAIASPQIGAVFLTGSRAAGRAIHRQLAGRFDVLLALELGGNNPIVVADTELPMAGSQAEQTERLAELITFSSFVSAGQRCTCARRVVLVEGRATDQSVEALIQRTRNLRAGLPGDATAAHIGPLISRHAADSLRQTYDRLISLGCSPLIEFQTDPRRDNLVRPCLVDATSISAESRQLIGEMEWFGPLLVVQRASDFEQAVRSAAQTVYGLAAALIGGSSDMFDYFVDQVGAGVVNWNRPTTGAAGILPFGGLGQSGNHRPAGYFAIDACSDPVSSLRAETLGDSDAWGMVR